MGGLVASIVGAVFLIALPTDDLPGVALGSEAILVVERIAMLFTVWLLGLIVIARALAGELPIEISGRGLRYADAATAQSGRVDSEAALGQIREEVKNLRLAVTQLELRQDREAPHHDDML